MNMLLQIGILGFMIFIFMAMVTVVLYFLLKNFMASKMREGLYFNETKTNLKEWTLHLESIFVQTLDEHLEYYKNSILEEFMMLQNAAEEQRYENMMSVPMTDDDDDEEVPGDVVDGVDSDETNKDEEKEKSTKKKKKKLLH